MNIEASLHVIAQHVQALLECTCVALSLNSPLEYSHPLLRLFMEDEELEQGQGTRTVLNVGRKDEGRRRGITSLVAVDCPKDVIPRSLLSSLITDAMRERTIQCANDCNLRYYNTTMRSVAIVPIERSAGLLGVLICLGTEQNGFLRGERMLLEQAIATVAREIELLLCDAVLDCVQESGKPVQGNNHANVAVELPEQQTLVSLVGHDLRLPLTAIKGYAGLLQAYGSTSTAVSTQTDIAPDMQRHYLNVIMEQTQHMEVLVNDLLDVSRIQHGQLALRWTWVDIISLCRDVVQMIQDKVDSQEAGRYTIRFNPDGQTTLLWTDPDRIQQVLTNLLENAIKYSSDGGLIEVVLHSSHRSSSVTVRDWGTGIPHRQQNTLFRLFERGSQQDSPTIAGMGIGLYIARILIEAMDGSITLSSSEGQGTSVSFTLPRSVLTETAHIQNTPIVTLNPC